jgi:Ca2+-binding EF-hand superfamily protein
MNNILLRYRVMFMQVCGVQVTDNVVDIIFHVFDANRDGSLSASEFIRVTQRREDGSSRSGLGSMISCWLNCVTSKCT